MAYQCTIRFLSLPKASDQIRCRTNEMITVGERVWERLGDQGSNDVALKEKSCNN